MYYYRQVITALYIYPIFSYPSPSHLHFCMHRNYIYYIPAISRLYSRNTRFKNEMKAREYFEKALDLGYGDMGCDSQDNDCVCVSCRKTLKPIR